MLMRDDFGTKSSQKARALSQCIEDPLVLCRTVAATAADAGGGGGSTPEREREFAGRGNGRESRDSVNVTKNSSEDILTQRPKALGWEHDIFCTFSVLLPGASVLRRARRAG